jgi:hypothetical protein
MNRSVGTCSIIGVGVSKPISVTARVNSALIESVEKEIIIKGNVLDENAAKAVDKLKPGNELLISRISARGFDKSPMDIWIEVSE